MQVTPLHLFSAAPEFFYAKAGCLDDPMLVLATHQNWVKSRVPWAVISAELTGFAEAVQSR